jgi:hypothetical protein
LLVLQISPLPAQNLSGYQKLRGEVISTPPDDDYTRHAYNAFDTNEGTSFMAQEINGWVGLDLGASHAIRKIRVYPMPDRHGQFEGVRFQGADNPGFNNAVTLLTVNQGLTPNEYKVYDISNSQTFRYVRCMNPDHRVSLAELEFYTDANAQTVNYRQLTNLPTIYLETGGQFDFINKSTWAEGKVAVANSGAATIFDAQIRGRGNSTWDFMDKKSFRIKFDKKQHFLGLPANAKNWTLIACAVDKTLLRNGLAFEISRALDFGFTPSCLMVDVVLDGFYFGTYMASDHIEVNENRINVDEMEPGDITEPNITGGYHLEIDAYANQEPVYFVTPRGMPFTIKSPDSDEIVPLQKQWIENHIRQLEDTLFLNPGEAIERYIDLESAVKYYLHSELTGNCDSYWCIPCYKKRGDEKLYFGPVWDYDQAFLTNYRVPLYTETLSTQHGVAQGWFRRIMQQPAAQTLLHQLWKQLENNGLQQHLIDYLDDNSALLQQSQALNYARWNSLNRKVWFEDTLFDTYDKYIDFVKWFINERFAWFGDLATERHALLAPSTPNYEPHSWRYTFDTPSADWYTSDFNDSQWLEGNAPFGTERNLQNTDWRTNQIYIRTRFYVNDEDLQNLRNAWFYVFHDEDCQIYLNDELALGRDGYITDYQYFEFDKDLLQAGWNTLAVKCTQSAGGQLIDVGIFATLEEPGSNLNEITAANHSQFDLTLTWDSETALGGSTRPLFGILLPEGWRVAGKGGDFTVLFSNNDTATGQFAFCQFYSGYLAENLETPPGYYWWGGRAIDKIQFNSRISFDIDFSLKVVTDGKAGNFDLKFAAGNDPSNTIAQHFISEPFRVSVSDANEFPAPETYNWEQINGNFNTEYFGDKDFDGYFLRYYGWNGGDVAMSTLLPDGRSIWTWGDYDAGVVNSERNRLRELNQFPRNALMLQEPYRDFSAFRLLTYGKKPGQIEPAIVYRDNAGNKIPDGEEWYWPMGGHIYYRNGVPELQVLLEHTRNAGGGQWGMAAVSTDVAVFSLPGLELVNVAKNRYTGEIGFGNVAFRDDDGVVYIYGERSWGICVGSTFIARNTDGDLTGEWEFYNGLTKTWSTDCSWQNAENWMDYAVLHKPLFVFKDGGKYFAFEQEPCFSPNSYVHDAESPVGPFTNRRLVGVLPQEITTNNFICYIPTLHPQFSKDGELLYSVSKNYNGDFDRYGNNQSANYYLPYFFRVKKWRDKLNIVANDITAGDGDFSAQFAETLQNIGDKNENTAYAATTDNGKAWIQYTAGQALFLRRYTLTSGNDATKDPLHWQLLGSADSVHWTVLDERYHAGFDERGQTNSYTVAIDRTCRYFRLNVLAVNGSQELQIAEWQLFGQRTGSDDPGETAIRKPEAEAIHIYPNPASNQLFIDTGKSTLKAFTVYDISGRKITGGKQLNPQSLDISALSAGMYLLEVETESGSKTLKFNKKQ